MEQKRGCGTLAGWGALVSGAAALIAAVAVFWTPKDTDVKQPGLSSPAPSVSAQSDSGNRSQDSKSDTSSITTDVSQAPGGISMSPTLPSASTPPVQSPRSVQPIYTPVPRESDLNKTTPSISSKSEVPASSTGFPISAQLIGQTSGSRVNIRSAPSTRSDSPHYGLVGDRITALQQTKGDDGNIWYFVQFSSGATGWVRGDFVELY
jgi:hypothetical protein